MQTTPVNLSRREVLKSTLLIATFLPLCANAAKNQPLRTSLKYKNTPEGDKQCNSCSQWVAGPTPKDLGGCKLFPGDTEVDPKGYCVAWAKKP